MLYLHRAFNYCAVFVVGILWYKSCQNHDTSYRGSLYLDRYWFFERSKKVKVDDVAKLLAFGEKNTVFVNTINCMLEKMAV